MLVKTFMEAWLYREDSKENDVDEKVNDFVILVTKKRRGRIISITPQFSISTTNTTALMAYCVTVTYEWEQ